MVNGAAASLVRRGHSAGHCFQKLTVRGGSANHAYYLWVDRYNTLGLGANVPIAEANGSESLLRATVAHEFGHLIAFQFGSQAFNGAAPEGWPTYSNVPAEAWADCVSRAFTGINDPSHGLPDWKAIRWPNSWAIVAFRRASLPLA